MARNYINYSVGGKLATSRGSPLKVILHVLKIAASGYNHVLAIRTDKYKTWTWGGNGYGQLGDYSKVSRQTPVSIKGTQKTFCKISVGYTHSISIDKNGLVWCWGSNTNGSLGVGTTVSKCTPVSILGGNKTFCEICGGWDYTCAIDKGGLIWAWGDNGFGQLGVNNNTNYCTPVSVLGTKKTFCNIKASVYRSLGIDKGGLVWGWGYNPYGEIGDYTTVSKKTPVSILGTKKTFCVIAAGGFLSLKPIAAPYTFSLAIDKNGLIWGWGRNAYRVLGTNSTTNQSTPVSILGGKKTFCKISCGDRHSAGIDKNGLVWSWGTNTYGQLGNNSTTSEGTPVSILGGKKTFCEIISGQYHTIALERTGRLWSWGYNDMGQLGDNTVASKRTPIMVSYL